MTDGALSLAGHPAWFTPPSSKGAPDDGWLMVLAHGAGAGMHHPFMHELAVALAGHGMAVVRWEFPYMAAKKKRPDPASVCEAATAEVVAAAAHAWPERRLVVAGKSMGGRMASRAVAHLGLPAAAALVFYGFPLHPADKPGSERAEHLSAVRLPMLFLSGTRDDLAEIDRLRAVVAQLGANATLREYAHADHAFLRRKRDVPGAGSLIPDLASATSTWLRDLREPRQTAKPAG